jgi:hypothetical protein
MSKISCNSIKDSGFSRPKPTKPNFEKPSTWGAGSDNGVKKPSNNQESASNPVDKVCPEIRAAIRGGGGSVEVDSATPMTGGGKVRADKIDSVISGLISSFAN